MTCPGSGQSRRGVSLAPFATLNLLLALLVFSGAWFWGQTQSWNESVQDAPTLVPFRYLLWALTVFLAITYCHVRGLPALPQRLWLFLPLIIVGFLSGLGGDIVESVRPITFFLLAVISAGCCGSLLSNAALVRTVFYFLVAVLAVSATMSLLLPAYGVSADGQTWRGVFSNKNQLGAVAAVAGIFLVASRSQLGWLRTGLLGVLVFGCLFGAKSAGATGSMAVAVIFYCVVKIFLKLRLSVAAGVTVLLIALALLAAIGTVAWDNLLSLFGRDESLTGRTDIWSVYFNEALKNPWLGTGPGTFSGGPVGQRLSLLLEEHGLIVTPHNKFLAAFGEVGAIGLLFFVAPLVYFVFFLPFQKRTEAAVLASAFAFLFLARGMVETGTVFNGGIEIYLIVLFYSRSMDQSRQPAIRGFASSAV